MSSSHLTGEERAILELLPQRATCIAYAHSDPDRGREVIKSKLPSAELIDVYSDPRLPGFQVANFPEDSSACSAGRKAPSPPADHVIAFGERQSGAVANRLPFLRAVTILRPTVILCDGIQLCHRLYRTAASAHRYSRMEPIPAYQVKPGLLGPASRSGFSVISVAADRPWEAERIALDLSDRLRPEDEAIVVALGATDRTLRRIQTAISAKASNNDRPVRCSKVHLVIAPSETGFAEALNLGLTKSTGEYVLLTESADLSLRLFNGFESQLSKPIVGAVGPVTDEQIGKQWHYFHRVQSVDSPPSALKRLHQGRPAASKSLAGFCLALRRQTLDLIGLLDEDFLLGGFDLELCLRLRLNGFVLAISRETQMHYHAPRLGPNAGALLETLTCISSKVLEDKLTRLFAPDPIPSSANLFGIDVMPPYDRRAQRLDWHHRCEDSNCQAPELVLAGGGA